MAVEQSIPPNATVLGRAWAMVTVRYLGPDPGHVSPSLTRAPLLRASVLVGMCTILILPSDLGPRVDLVSDTYVTKAPAPAPFLAPAQAPAQATPALQVPAAQSIVLAGAGAVPVSNPVSLTSPAPAPAQPVVTYSTPGGYAAVAQPVTNHYTTYPAAQTTMPQVIPAPAVPYAAPGTSITLIQSPAPPNPPSPLPAPQAPVPTRPPPVAMPSRTSAHTWEDDMAEELCLTVAEFTDTQQSQMRQEMHEEVDALRKELMKLREELASAKAPPPPREELPVLLPVHYPDPLLALPLEPVPHMSPAAVEPLMPQSPQQPVSQLQDAHPYNVVSVQIMTPQGKHSYGAYFRIFNQQQNKYYHFTVATIQGCLDPIGKYNRPLRITDAAGRSYSPLWGYYCLPISNDLVIMEPPPFDDGNAVCGPCVFLLSCCKWAQLDPDFAFFVPVSDLVHFTGTLPHTGRGFIKLHKEPQPCHIGQEFTFSGGQSGITGSIQGQISQGDLQ
eukprot:gene10207-1843_t